MWKTVLEPNLVAVMVWAMTLTSTTFALVAETVLSRVTSRKMQISNAATKANKKMSPRKSLTVLTSESLCADTATLAATPRTERRTFMNKLNNLLSPTTFYHTHAGEAAVPTNPLFSPLKSFDGLFCSPRVSRFGMLLSPKKAVAKSKVQLPLQKLKEERDMMHKEIKEVAVRGLFESILTDLLSGYLQDGPSYVADPVIDTEHLSLKIFVSDFFTGSIDAMRRTAFPQMATMMIRELSSPTNDDSSVTPSDHEAVRSQVRAHVFTLKVLIRYLIMPMLVRGVAHTAPAMAFHLAENEFKLFEHTHHLF